ncbi:peptidoglycan-binding protein [Salicibibacter kimchii]|uniref:Peptidoglycan-binding protein n=1 Tax=Salicibibacter kimchii TaxID=2099786 RepID=A0A345BZR2_9BACI|nr:peptidoglycan-binding protein [Salicibibacter kimchii]AXF56443.1 peptidoglycan-binding protein [Salicibibacter kimchii]
MLEMQTPNWVNNYILSALVAGLIFFALPVVTEAGDTESKLLTEGVESTHVEDLQESLQEEGYLKQGDVSGVYDNQTSDAVKNYQEDHDLMVDGMAGVQTLGAIKVLEKGDDYPLVADLQETLQAYGYYDGSLDGHFDSETDDSVRSFQSDAEIEVDGLAGPETFGALYYESSEETTEGNGTEEAVEEETVEEETTEEEATEEEPSDEASTSNDESSSDAEGETYTMEATAYTANCEGCSGVTATGIDLNNNRDANVVAVDPNVIPLGSTVHVEGYGEAVAGDTGGAINGEKVDLHYPSQEEAEAFGVQDVEVTVLD